MNITAKTSAHYNEMIVLNIESGNTTFEIHVLPMYFDVIRRVNGKKSAIAGALGKTFFSISDICSHYKALKGMETAIQQTIDNQPKCVSLTGEKPKDKQR